MEVGLVSSVEANPEIFLRKKEHCPKTAASTPACVSSLPVRPTDLRLDSVHSRVSQFFKISLLNAYPIGSIALENND